MEKEIAIASLAALAQETRLDAFRLLVQAGPTGLAAGEIATALQTPAATLSFHLKELKSAGVVSCVRRGRSLIYHAHYEQMQALVDYLTEHCCRGAVTH